MMSMKTIRIYINLIVTYLQGGFQNFFINQNEQNRFQFIK